MSNEDPMAPENNWSDEAADAATRHLMEAWPTVIGCDQVFAEQVGREAAKVIWPFAYRAGRDDVARDIERPDSPLCDCPRLENAPINPDTKEPMDHHCDCRAVETAAIMLGTYSKTEHAKQCVHGTEMDLFYRHAIAGEAR